MTSLGIAATDRVLAIAPHQDDESIGCGGALSAWGRAGATTGVLWVSATTTGETVGAEARNAAAALGLNWSEGLGEPPVGLAEERRVLIAIVAGMRRFRPTVVLLPHDDEDDRQHRVVSALAQEAEWIAAYEVDEDIGTPLPARPRLVLGYEVWTPMRRPTTHVDITSAVPGKRAAINCYESQQEITEFAEAALSLNRYRGLMSGAGRYAEAYQVLRVGKWEE